MKITFQLTRKPSTAMRAVLDESSSYVCSELEQTTLAKYTYVENMGADKNALGIKFKINQLGLSETA